MISRYQRLREVGTRINNQLVGRLSRETLNEGGKRLGILRGDTLVFDTQDESMVLMDYCIYNVLRDGRNAVEQFLIDCPPNPDSDEMACLRAMQHAIYSLFAVESVDRGLGVTVRDLLSQEVLLVVDMGFGGTAKPGLVFASRLLQHGGFWITGGAALPVAVVPADQQGRVIKTLSLLRTPGQDRCFDPAGIIRKCLREGSASRIQYQTPTGLAISHPAGAVMTRTAAAGRNSPCPCGSGRKFKHCCLRNQ